jgi:tRNA dimethylallyltransferase
MKKLVAIVGPTASGKTEWGIYLAKKFKGAVINADSRQIYQDLNIGTGKPRLSDRGRTSRRGPSPQNPKQPFIYKGIEHYLFNIVSPDKQFNAAKYQKLAFQTIDWLQKRKRCQVPFLVGGTGLYVAAVVKNYRFLKNKKSSRFGPPRYEILEIGIEVPRAELYQRLNKRVDEMIARGLRAEVKSLAKKYGTGNPVLKSTIGYQEWLPYFATPLSRSDLHNIAGQIKKNSRHFARRQLTWFRADPEIKWVKSLKEAKKLVREFLA